MDPNNRKAKNEKKEKRYKKNSLCILTKQRGAGRVREHAQEFSPTLEQRDEDKEKRQICKTSCIHILCIVKAAN